MFPVGHVFLFRLLIIGAILMGLSETGKACEFCGWKYDKITKFSVTITADEEILVGNEQVVSSFSRDAEALYKELMIAKRQALLDKSELLADVSIDEFATHERYILVLDTFAKAKIYNSCVAIYPVEDDFNIMEKGFLGVYGYNKEKTECFREKDAIINHVVSSSMPPIRKSVRFQR